MKSALLSLQGWLRLWILNFFDLSFYNLAPGNNNEMSTMAKSTSAGQIEATTAAWRLNERRSPTDIRGPLVKAITSGSKLALESCQTEFRWEKWNCPMLSFARRHGELVTKEMAFIAAVQAAGVAYQVSKTCSSGSVHSCGCQKGYDVGTSDDAVVVDEASVKDNWQWGGCVEDVSMGMAASQRFFDSLENDSVDVVTRVNKHNSMIGSMAIKHTSQVVCRCHGILGSCTTKTCWRKLSPFQDIGQKLKFYYQKAQRVQGNRAITRGSFDFPVHKLIFLEDSPNYCKPNATNGWPGTGGRICSLNNRFAGGQFNRSSSADKSERRSCREICRSCGHQVRRRPANITWNCNCSFEWCCNVKCETCQKTIMQTYCDDRPVELH